jgi:hypothetical protein
LAGDRDGAQITHDHRKKSDHALLVRGLVAHTPEVKKIPDGPPLDASFVAVDTLHNVAPDEGLHQHILSVIANGWICKRTSFEEARFIHWIWGRDGTIRTIGTTGRWESVYTLRSI